MYLTQLYLPHESQVSEGDPKCIFFTLNTYQETFISEILWCKGPFTKDIRFFGPFFDLPTYPYPIFSHWNHWFNLAISDFHKPTYLPKNRVSFLDAPQLKFLKYDIQTHGRTDRCEVLNSYLDIKRPIHCNFLLFQYLKLNQPASTHSKLDSKNWFQSQ